MAKRRRKRKRAKHTAQKRQQLCFDFDPEVPTYDFFEYMDVDDLGYIDQALDNLIHDIETGFFLQWGNYPAPVIARSVATASRLREAQSPVTKGEIASLRSQ